MQYRYVLMIFVVTLAATTILTQTNDASASEGLNKSIGIALSRTCVTMVTNNFTTNCPSYNGLVGLDTSDQRISGGFEMKDGMLQRVTENKLINHYRFYDYEKDWNFFIDPPSDMRERVRMIILENNFDKFLLRGTGESFNLNDGLSLTYGIDRYVNPGCTQAVIGSDDWKALLPDTIAYIRSGCDDTQTWYADRLIINHTRVEHDITTSQKYKDEQKLNYIKENCLKEYGTCNYEDRTIVKVNNSINITLSDSINIKDSVEIKNND